MPIEYTHQISANRPLEIVAMVKQIPVFQEMELDESGRLIRSGEANMNDYCRRAVAMGQKIARASGGKISVLTMGPPKAENVLREALLYGVDSGILLCDEELAGSDTLMTAQALVAAIRYQINSGSSSTEIPTSGSTISSGGTTNDGKSRIPDLILCGRNSLDSDTGQVPPQIAELLGLPFAGGVRSLELQGETLLLGLEQNDEYLEASLELPAVITCAERLIEPCKIKDPELWETADASKIQTLSTLNLSTQTLSNGDLYSAKDLYSAEDLYPAEDLDSAKDLDLHEKPSATSKLGISSTIPIIWGQAGSPTSVGKVYAQNRLQKRVGKIFDARHKNGTASTQENIEAVANLLEELQSSPTRNHSTSPAPSPTMARSPETARASKAETSAKSLTALVLLEEKRDSYNAELLSTALRLTGNVDNTTENTNTKLFAIQSPPNLTPEDFSNGTLGWMKTKWENQTNKPDFILSPSTDWGREVASRIAARLKCGLVGDAIGAFIQNDKLVSQKPAFCGSMVAEIHCKTTPQMATIREGVFPADLISPQELKDSYPDDNSTSGEAQHSQETVQETDENSGVSKIHFPQVQFPQVQVPQVQVPQGQVPQVEAPRIQASKAPYVQNSKQSRPASRLKILKKTRIDSSAQLTKADFVVGIGNGVDPQDIAEIAEKVKELGGELAATRKITDGDLLPRSRQIGITGRSIAPRLYIGVATSGKFNHLVGVAQADIIIAINSDPTAEIFDSADIGIVSDYKEILTELLANPKIKTMIMSLANAT